MKSAVDLRGANPATFEFTATMPALEYGIAFFKVKLNIFVFKMH
jgi:hypothetical protein